MTQPNEARSFGDLSRVAVTVVKGPLGPYDTGATVQAQEFAVNLGDLIDRGVLAIVEEPAVTGEPAAPVTTEGPVAAADLPLPAARPQAAPSASASSVEAAQTRPRHSATQPQE